MRIEVTMGDQEPGLIEYPEIERQVESPILVPGPQKKRYKLSADDGENA